MNTLFNSFKIDNPKIVTITKITKPYVRHRPKLGPILTSPPIEADLAFNDATGKPLLMQIVISLIEIDGKPFLKVKHTNSTLSFEELVPVQQRYNSAPILSQACKLMATHTRWVTSYADKTRRAGR
jgi:hypothetical protein